MELIFLPRKLNKKFKMKSREVFIYFKFLNTSSYQMRLKKGIHPCSLVVQGHPDHFDLILCLTVAGHHSIQFQIISPQILPLFI
jgi:hypothetical protein